MEAACPHLVALRTRRATVSGKARFISSTSAPTLPPVIRIRPEAVLRRLVALRITRAQADRSIESLQEALRIRMNPRDLRFLNIDLFAFELCELDDGLFRLRALSRAQRPGVRQTSVCDDHEPLRALHPNDLPPVHWHRAVHVVQTDQEHPVYQAFDFAGDAVPVLQVHHIRLLSRF